MTNAIITVDDFGVRVPEPLEPFTNTIIHPRNLAIQQRQEEARKLTRAELIDTSREADDLRKLLDQVGYYDQLAEYKLLKRRYSFYQSAAESADNDEDRAEQVRLLEQTRQRGAALRQSLSTMQGKAARHQHLTALLKDHQLAVERDKAHARLNQLMAKEAERWKQIIVETWTRMGYAHQGYDKRGRKIVHKVQFSEVVITPDAVWYKVYVTVKTWFGYRSALPYSVKVADLIDEKTLEELSHACQRQVTAEASYQNGVWVKVNRIGTTDGLLNYVTLEQVLNSYPHDQRTLMPIPIGVGDGRNISWIMLAEHPHFLVAGSTGNGKSNASRVFVNSLIRFQSPDELQFALIDLKEGVEFAPYAEIPHLMMPIIKRVEDAVNALAQIDKLREERMEVIAKARCNGILEYNERHPDNKLPRVLVMIDEYARVKARGKEFEAIADRAVGEITALGRAAGIHLYAATQTPYARILPGEAKNNMALRLALAQATIEASKSIVGNRDAYDLAGDPIGRAIAAMGAYRWKIQMPESRPVDNQRSVEVAMEWQRPRVTVKLPDVVHIDVFDQSELLDIAINELGGNLGARPIYEFVKESQSVTQSEVREMVKALTQQKELEFEGRHYLIVKVKSGFRLELSDTQELRNSETGVPHT